MTFGQIITYLIIAAVIYLIGRRIFLVKSLKHYSAPEVSKILRNGKKALLLDVRTAGERNADKINGSLHIPLQEIGKRFNELEKFKQKEIICYCRSGSRSLTAAAKLQKRGFTTANLKGGIVRWNASVIK